jgi:D-arabinose 1-dehydrogenase-like Zn-dependent alcohol dehydrogenase
VRAALVEGPGKVVVREVPMPEMGPYQGLVRIEACGICNSTDVKIIDRHFVSQIPLPLVLGHESVGTVVEVGDRVRAYAPGQRVLRPGAEYDYGKVGIASAWGGLAEYGLVTDLAAWQADHPGEKPGGMWAKQQIVPREIDPVEATAIITLKETLSSIRRVGVDQDSWVAIVGTGPVARAFTFWAHWLGVRFLAVFGRRERWCDDMLTLGANNYVYGDKPCVEDEAKAVGVRAFDRAIEAVGSKDALEDALALVRSEGWVANYGVSGEDDPPSDLVREAYAQGRIRNIAVREEEVHEELLELVARGEVTLADWVTDRLPLERIDEGIRRVRAKEALKVVIEMDQNPT